MQSISQEVFMGLEKGMQTKGNESIMGLDGRERPEGSPLVESCGGLRPDVRTASWRRSSHEVGVVG